MAGIAYARTIYVCTYVHKTIEVDHYQKGCSGESECVLSDRVDIEADNLSGLIEAIGAHFGLKIVDVFIPADEGEPITHIGFNQLEDVDGNEPGEAQLAKWKKGKLKLYLADYHFGVERRIVAPLSLKEFEAANIITH